MAKKFLGEGILMETKELIDLEKACKEYSEIVEKKRNLLKRSDEIKESKIKVLKKRQKAIIQNLTDSFNLSKVTRTVIAWRKRALKQTEVRALLEKYNISIEDVAFIEEGDEEWNLDFERQYDNHYLPELYDFLLWKKKKFYKYGSPKTPVQIFFKNIPGSGYKFSGLFLRKEVFPKKGIFSLFGRKKKAA